RGAVATPSGPPPAANREAEPHDAHDRALRLASLQATAHQPTGHPLRDADRLDILLPLPDGEPAAADATA
ncbi:hypothetical protein AN220_27705, partial [Streptomyces nanshensis]